MTRRIVSIVTAVVLAAAACGGDDEVAPTTSSSSSTSTTDATTTTVKKTTTTAKRTTTTVKPDPVYPLTGEPLVDEAVAGRPALVVKIDNNRKARPQSGLNQADIVFEEIVEIQTRFAAVFQTQVPDPVGPIRSGRTQDVIMLGSLGRPLFVWSGGNRGTTKIIESSYLINLSAMNGDVYDAGGFYRDRNRSAPHNLLAQGSGLYSLVPFGIGPPRQQFDYFEKGDKNPGKPAAGFDVDMDTLLVGWRYDAGSGNYLRSTGGEPHNDTSGQVNSKNVVIMVVEYRPSPVDARSPEAQTVGSGEVRVYTGGTEQIGTWTRKDQNSPYVFKDAKGQPIELTPGRTWIELAKAGTYVTVPAA